MVPIGQVSAPCRRRRRCRAAWSTAPAKLRWYRVPACRRHSRRRAAAHAPAQYRFPRSYPRQILTCTPQRSQQYRRCDSSLPTIRRRPVDNAGHGGHKDSADAARQPPYPKARDFSPKKIPPGLRLFRRPEQDTADLSSFRPIPLQIGGEARSSPETGGFRSPTTDAQFDGPCACLPVPFAVAVTLDQPIRILLAERSASQRSHFQLHQPVAGKRDHLASRSASGLFSIIARRFIISSVIGGSSGVDWSSQPKPNPRTTGDLRTYTTPGDTTTRQARYPRQARIQKVSQVALGARQTRPLDGDGDRQLAHRRVALGANISAGPVNVPDQIQLLGDPGQCPHIAEQLPSLSRQNQRKIPSELRK